MPNEFKDFSGFVDNVINPYMPKMAYSYIRFSTEHQAQGDSLRRQEEATRGYCKKHNLLLDDSLNLKDLGVSAFKGANAEKGALGKFLAACEKGLIKKGSALVVESLDRLSRQSPRRTVTLLNQLLDDYQVEIHLTMADKVFKPSEDNGIDLIMAVAMAMRANEESETKSRRLCAAWEKLRERARKEKRVMISKVPWWLEVKNGKIVAIKERIAVVKRIFELTAQGYSSNQIARLFNDEKVPHWRQVKAWQSPRIRSLIRSEAPLGTLQETDRTRKTGKAYKIEGYYPRIVSNELAAKARNVSQRNAPSSRGRANTTDRPCNLLRGLLRYKGIWVRQSAQQNGKLDPDTGKRSYHTSYECIDDSTGKALFSISGKQLEPVIIRGLLELKPEDFLPLTTTLKDNKVETLRGKVALLENKAKNLLDAIESGSTLVAGRLKELEGKLIEAKTVLSRAEAEEQAISAPVRINVNQLKADLSDNATRERTAAALRRLLTQIDIGRELKDIPTNSKLRAAIAKALFQSKGEFTKDPVPDSKLRKPLYLLLNFESGAKRLLARLPNSKEGIINVRVEAL